MHPLTGPRLKVRRAIREINSLGRAEDAFLIKANYRVASAEFNPKTKKRVYRIKADAMPPLDWGIRIGEIAHNLRSSLDGLAWQLALLETDAPAERTQFPIFRVGSTIRKVGGNKIPHFECDGRRLIRDLRPEHQAIIQWLQPYKRGRGGADNLLHLLREINNSDKHRLIQVVGARAAKVEFTVTIGDVPTGLPLFRFVMLEDGAKFGEAAEDVSVEPDLAPYVAFWKGCPVGRGKPVHINLSRIAKHVSEIIEGFAPEFS